MSEPGRPPLLSAALLQRLERLRVLARRTFRGTGAGDRRTRQAGLSIEFRDHRAYAPGDDVRHLDWNVHARLDRLHLKRFHDHQDVTVHLVVDASGSMAFGSIPKVEAAKALSAALSWLVLSGADRACLHVLGEKPVAPSPPFVGRAGLRPLLALVESVTAGGNVNLGAALERTARALRRPGIVFVVSDFLSAGALPGLERLAAGRHQLHLILVLAPEEADLSLDDGLRADMTLEDSETGEHLSVTLSPRLRAAHRAALDAHVESLEAFARRSGATFTRVRSDDAIEDVLLRQMQARGILG